MWIWGVSIFNKSYTEQFISSWNTISVHDYSNSERTRGTYHDSAATQLDYINTENKFPDQVPRS